MFIQKAFQFSTEQIKSQMLRLQQDLSDAISFNVSTKEVF